MKYFLLLLLPSFTAALADGVDIDASPKIAYKFSFSDYTADNLHAIDLNLRGTIENQTAWLAYYKEHDSGFDQTRTGYERKDKSDWYKVTSSIQAATHGFMGVAVTAELGGTVHGIVGYGRTNLRPYDNINFDPNDAITYGVGWEVKEGEDIALYRVRDNRVTRGQQIDHLLVHFPVNDGDKASIDIFNKSGTRDIDGKPISATGAALTYEWPKYFLRAAYDPKVNFSQAYMTRLSFGIYF